MITRKDNFVTLADNSGKELNPMDPGYIDFLITMSKQDDAARTNVASKADYLTKLNNYQASLDAGRGGGLVVPAKPQVQLVDDAGVVSYVDFNPPLPDPRPITNVTPSTGGFSTVVTKTTTDDISKKLDALLQLISLLISKISTK